MDKTHHKYIERTFYLAKKGLGNVKQNPMVGCVIVKDNKIIGEGYHKKYGKEHAEINAIKSVTNKKEIKGSLKEGIHTRNIKDLICLIY